MIRVVDFKAQMVETFCGDGHPCLRDGPLFECSFNDPRKITYSEKTGLLFISNNSSVRVIDVNNEMTSTLHLNNTLQVRYSFCVELTYKNPYGIMCIDDADKVTVFVADIERNVIIKAEVDIKAVQ